MKTIMFAAALMLGGAAIAQTSTDTMPPETANDPNATEMAPAPAPMAGGSTVAPGNAAPERDARGIPVVSDPAMAPGGANQAPPSGPAVPAPNQQAVFATQASTKEYKPCTKTVTDGCVQTYERGRTR
ncbi:hypothetical protein [Allosphingosinicella indica]|uniref:Fe-S oxidoreductase n=1 Tax=Allosphingosinicella indica TaxID=941907 RepID=A0A1X7H142_9SPHN|nr:hypothetical protein [Allosphingosinicella indica]SMF77729.1 hypothetical protein SAMN06295910_2621 [Allosphingosinicella indica]